MTTSAAKDMFFTALDDLGDSIDGDDFVLEVEAVRIELLLHCHISVLDTFWAGSKPVRKLELETGFTRSFGEGLDATMVEVAAAIKDDLLDALFLERARR